MLDYDCNATLKNMIVYIIYMIYTYIEPYTHAYLPYPTLPYLTLE